MQSVASGTERGKGRLAASLPLSDLAHGALALVWLWIFYRLYAGMDAVLFEQTAEVGPYVALAAVSALPAVFFPRLGYAGFEPVFRTTTWMTALGILVYLVAEPADFTLAVPEGRGLAWCLWIGYPLAIAAGVISLWRPAFLGYSAFFVLATRGVAEEIAGIKLSLLDVRFIVEMAEFLVLTACLLALLERAAQGQGGLARLAQKADRRLLALSAAFITYGFHLANYFWSAIEKIELDPGPIAWILENQTQHILLIGLKRGAFPFGHWPETTQAMYDGLGAVIPWVNAFVLLTQLVAILAVARLAWLRASSVFYDIQHLGIWLASGVLFWPWIWINITILAAMRGLKEAEVPALPRFLCIAVIVLRLLPDWGAAAQLGWYDLRDVKIATFEAQAGDDGEWVQVPASYFLSHSYTMSLGYMDLSVQEGHYYPTIWGSARYGDAYERMKSSGQCLPPPPMAHPEPPSVREARLAMLDRFFQAHHAKMVSRAEWLPDHWYYWRSHHHPSNPAMHAGFNGLRIADITAYRMRTRSTCLSLEGGQLQERVVAEYFHTFPVAR